MRIFTFCILLLSFTTIAQKSNKYETYFEKGNGNQSANYQETIKYFTLLAHDFPTIKMQEMGLTDSGFINNLNS